MPDYALDRVMPLIHLSARVSKTSGPLKSRAPALPAPIEAFRLPRPRKGMTARDFAIRLLQAGAEIEHSLLVQYLYAAYSVNDRADNDNENVGLLWQMQLRLVAR